MTRDTEDPVTANGDVQEMGREDAKHTMREGLVPLKMTLENVAFADDDTVTDVVPPNTTEAW